MHKSIKSLHIRKEAQKIIERIKKLHYMHYLALAITLGSGLLAAFKFRSGIIRIGESLRDIGTSIAYYFIELFELNFRVPITVNEYSVVPAVPIFNLPATWEEFKVMWVEYWKLWASWDNFLAFGDRKSVV